MGTLSRENSTSNPQRAPHTAVNATWRERAHSHYQNILDLLRVRGPAGVLSTELYDNPALFGRSPRNRVSEMRRDGFQIRTVHVNASTVRYLLLADRGGQPATAAAPPELSGLPLFDSAVRQ
jgi:hypothetical protein